MEKKIRIVLVIAIFLSLFLPTGEGKSIIATYYFGNGILYSITLLFGVIQIPDEFSFRVSLQGGSPSVSELLEFTWSSIKDALYLTAHLFWNNAIPFLFIWNLYLIKPRSILLKKVYRIWLLISFISVIYIHSREGRGTPWYELNFWFILIFPGIAILIEIWLRLRNKTNEIPSSLM